MPYFCFIFNVLLSLFHKGSLDIVLFFLIRKMFGLNYILWASPIMAAVALLIGLVLLAIDQQCHIYLLNTYILQHHFYIPEQSLVLILSYILP